MPAQNPIRAQTIASVQANSQQYHFAWAIKIVVEPMIVLLGFSEFEIQNQIEQEL